MTTIEESKERKVYTGKFTVIEGDVKMADGSNIWHNSVIRADSAPVSIGENTNIQDGCIIHTDEGFPASIGRSCTIGHRAIIHGCSIEDECLIGMGAIVMNGAHISKHSIIGAGALVLENMEIPPGSLVVGVPAKIIGQVKPEQIEEIKKNARDYLEHAQKQLQYIVAQEKQ